MAAFSKIISALVLLALLALGAVRFGLVSEGLNPFSPLALDDPGQWFVDFKLAALRDDPALCRAVLDQRHVDAAPVPDRPLRDGCGWSNSVAFSRIGGAGLAVRPLTCEMTAATALWVIQDVQPAARAAFGSGVAEIHHMGTYSCRNIAGSNRRSQHAKANAIDISGFTLEDGRHVSVRDWNRGGPKAAFLNSVYDSACRYFRVTLGPDYNAAHADHFHFDRSGFWMCA
jgi:hypothetical protein